MWSPIFRDSIYFHVVLYKLSDGCVLLFFQVGVVTDITARKSTAEAMHLCDKALAATSEATLITDSNQADNPIIYCNSGFTKLLGEHLCSLCHMQNRCLSWAGWDSSLKKPVSLLSLYKTSDHNQSVFIVVYFKLMVVLLSYCMFAGYTMQEVVGKNPRFMQGPDTDPGAIAELRDAVENGRATVVELINHRKDGTRFWNQVRCFERSQPGHE